MPQPAMDVVFLVYGLAFLAMGMTIVIRNERDSELDVARLLWLLAAFGFSHGFLEWMDLWRVVRGGPAWPAATQPLLLLLSYLFLFEFGRRLVRLSLPAAVLARPAGRLLEAWLYAPLLLMLAAGTAASDQPALGLTIWSRYLPGFFGSCLAGVGCWRYCRRRLGADAATPDFPGIGNACRVAAVAFVAYGIFGGLVVPRAEWFPAAAINQENFLAAFGVPVQLLRAVCAVFVAASVASLLRVFGLESRRKLRRALDAAQHALADLHRMNRRNEVILDSAAEGIVGLDQDGRTMFINDAALAMLGYQSGELIGRPFHALAHHTDAAGKAYAYEDCPIHRAMFNHGRHKVNDDMFWRKDGTSFAVEYQSAPLRDGEQVLGVVAVFQDITERKRAERRFRESERRMHALLDASQESTLLLDPGGNILAINTIGAARFGKTPGEMTGTNIFASLPPPLAESRRTTLQQVVAGAEPLLTHDRRGDVEFENNLFPVKGEAGEVEAVAVYAKDVTVQRRNERVDAMFHRLDLMQLKWRMDLGTIALMFCDEILPLFDLAAAWIARAEKDGTLTFVASAAGAGVDDFLDRVRETSVRWDGAPSCCEPAGAAIRSGNPQKIVLDDPDCPSCGAAARAAGAQAALIVPLPLRGETWGVLALYARQSQLLDRPEMPPHLATVASRLCVSLEASLQQEWLTLLDTALSTASNAVFIADAGSRILWANPAFEQLSGYASAEILGQTPRLFSSGLHDADFYRNFWQTIQSGEAWHGEVVNARRDGSRYTVNQTVTPLRNDNGKVSHYVSILEDISERKATEERINHMANFDALTDLPNRAMFFDRLGQSLALARRDAYSGALLFLDLDHFKEVNDSLGHAAGDLLLKAVAQRLRAQVRETDTVARLAGDEFTVTLPHVADIDDATHVADKIVAALSRRFDLNGHEVGIGVSIGVALFPDHGESVKKIVSAADNAMYAAKHAGRSTVRVYRPEQERTSAP